MSGIFVLLDAHFIAAVNLIVYAGAILVLFLFVIMLLNLGRTEKSDLRGPVYRMLGIAVGDAFFGLLLVDSGSFFFYRMDLPAGAQPPFLLGTQHLLMEEVMGPISGVPEAMYGLWIVV